MNLDVSIAVSGYINGDESGKLTSAMLRLSLLLRLLQLLLLLLLLVSRVNQ